MAKKKFTPSEQEAISRKIEFLKKEHPDWSQDQLIAVAIRYVTPRKSKR